MEKLPEFIGNNIFLVSLFIAILMMLIWNIYGSAASGIRQLSPMEATRLMNHDNAVVLDVRKAEDFKNAHILNALSFPDTETQSRQQEIEKYKERPVITYCDNGITSTRTARALKTAGVSEIYCLKGGIQAWRTANLPLTKDT